MKLLRKSPGITLIELIAVIGIIGIVYLISVPLYSMFQSTMLLKSTSQGIKNYIEQAKSLAQNYNRTFTIIVDPAEGKLATYDYIDPDVNNPYNNDADAVARRNQELIDANNDVTKAIQKVKDYIVPRQLTISANAGSMKITVSSAGTMNACSIWIRKNGTDKYYTVTTNASTGGVRVYNYKKNGS